MDFPKTDVPTGVSQWGMGDATSPFPELADFNMIVSPPIHTHPCPLFTPPLHLHFSYYYILPASRQKS